MKYLNLFFCSLIATFILGTATSNAYATSSEIWPGYTPTTTDWNTTFNEFGNYLEKHTDFIEKYSDKFGLAPMKFTENYYKSVNATWVYIETTVLYDALQTPDDDEKFKDFLAVHQYRHETVLNDQDKKYETAAEVGFITEYVCAKASQLDAVALAKSRWFYILPDFLSDFPHSVKDTVEYASGDFIAIGAGYKLDLLDPQGDWKHAIMENLQSPVDLLLQAYRKKITLSDDELRNRINKIKEDYHYDDNLQKMHVYLQD